MAWIKRNLFFVITVIVALGLAGYCGYLLLATLSDNAKASADCAAAMASLKELREKKPFPDAAAIKSAQDDAARVQSFLVDFRKPFASFPPPPKMDDRQFKEYLLKTVTQFGLDATNAGVQLYPGYEFGFGQIMSKLNFPPDCIEPWTQEMEEMRSILNILYAAKINFLEQLRRPQVSPDDNGESFTRFSPITNQNGVVTPYTVEFRAFSTEIANVLAGVAASSNCFIVKTLYVSKSTVALPQVTPEQPTQPTPMPQYIPRPAMREPSQDPFAPQGIGRGDREFRSMRRAVPNPQAPTAPTPVGPAPPETILTEVPLFVTLYIDVIKLKPLEVPKAAPQPNQPRSRGAAR
jgi:hypothetical protein